LIDGPSKSENAAVPRQSIALNNLIVTPIVIPKLPRAAGRGAVARAWEKEEVEKKWGESAWAKRREQREKRRKLSDFDRFKVLRLKKQVCSTTRLPQYLRVQSARGTTYNSHMLFIGAHADSYFLTGTVRGSKSTCKHQEIGEVFMMERHSLSCGAGSVVENFFHAG